MNSKTVSPCIRDIHIDNLYPGKDKSQYTGDILAEIRQSLCQRGYQTSLVVRRGLFDHWYDIVDGNARYYALRQFTLNEASDVLEYHFRRHAYQLPAHIPCEVIA